MTDGQQATPALVRQPHLQLPPTGSKEGKERWAVIDQQLKRELPHVFPGGLGSCDLDVAINRLHAVIRSLFPSVSVGSPKTRQSHPRRTVSAALRRRQRALRRQWAHRGCTEVEECTESLRKEYHILRREIRRRAKLARVQRDLALHAKNVQAFRKDPYKFAKRLFDKQGAH